MSSLHFDNIKGRGTEIIDEILAQPEITAEPQLDFALHLVMDELVTNVVSYAYPEGADGVLDVSVEVENDMLSITFSDSGVPFNPLQQDDPDITLGIEERPVGGLGIFLVKQMMDNVEYNYVDGRNVLKVSKSIAEKQ